MLEGEDVTFELDAVGLEEGLPVAELSDDADVLAVTDELADLAGVADELADVNGEAEELASAAAGAWLAAVFVAPESTVLFGMSGHAELMIDCELASAACSSANMLQPMNAKPVSAPSAAGLSISALTCVPSCAFWLR